MTYHPAEFARQGSKLLQSFREKLSQKSSDPNALGALLSTYDKQVAELLSKRKEMSQREYRAQAISSFQWGGVLSFLGVLLGSFLYGVIRGAHIPLQETILAAVIAGLVGGVFLMVSRAPRDLEYAETKDSLCTQLYQAPERLTRYYETIKGPYERKMGKQKPLPSEKKEEEKEKQASMKRRVRVRKELKEDMLVTTVMAEDKAEGKAPEQKKTVKRWVTKLWRKDGEEQRKKREFSIGFLRSMAERRATEGTKIKVLIIGDGAKMAPTTADPLKEKFEVVMAESGLLGLEKAVAESPQAILLDMEPLEDGYETCRKLTEHEATSGIPILVWTERAGREEILRAREAGASDYIVKGAEDTDHITDEPQAIAERIEKAIASQEKPIEKVLAESIRREQAEEESRVRSEEVAYASESVREDEKEDEVGQAAQQEAVSPSGKILAVGDDEDIRRLSGEGHYNVLFLDEAEKLVRTAMEERPDVILLDGEMKEINSFNMYKILHAKMSSTPVVMLVDPRQEYKTQEVGVSEYLIKPFAYQDLVEKLEHILGS